MSKNKTVYVLGAGASASAGIPTQVGILNLVYSIERAMLFNDHSAKDLVELSIDENHQKLQQFFSAFDQYRRELGDFIVSVFCTDEKKNQYRILLDRASEIYDKTIEESFERERIIKSAYSVIKSINVSLEDLFTVFDSAINNNECFLNYSPREMTDIHRKLKMCIIFSLAFAQNQAKCDDYDRFARYLVEKRLSVSQKIDNLSVITMNWDNLLERTINSHCQAYNKMSASKRIRILPDLCFHDDDYKKNPNHIPSVHIKAKGIRNIKILKMHGSLSWLECPKCGRIMTDYSNEIACYELEEVECPYCKTEIGVDNPKLRSLIITPTFLKSLDNLSIKNIWHNAYLDISEASRVVFIGYSLPDADYEMRHLLKKSIRRSANISVVLTDMDNPLHYSDILNGVIEDNHKEAILSRLSLPIVRYDNFFSGIKIDYYYGGFEQYLNRLGDDL